jgi:hypothetical protein
MLMNNNDAIAQFLAKGGHIKKMPTRYALGFTETAFDDWRELPFLGLQGRNAERRVRSKF